MLDVYDRLGVPADADLREIRRAYARELKKIDQQTNMEGFQELREAYELALYQLDPVQEPDLDILRPVTPEEIAGSAFERLRAATALLPSDDHQAWSDALAEYMAGEQLINLVARSRFEVLIADHLAAGWLPGNEALFAAAGLTFDWTNDQRRVAQLGHAGLLLNPAINEQQMLDAISQQQSAPLRAAISRMRDPRVPTTEELRHYNLPITRLRQRYPALMSVIVDGETFQRWQLALENAPALWQAPAAPAEDSWLQNLLYGLMVTAIILYTLSQVLT